MLPPPQRLPDGRIRIPMRAEAPDGIVGDGVVEIGPDDPMFDVWDGYLRSVEATGVS